MDTAGGEASPDLARQQRAQGVAHEPVHDAPGHGCNHQKPHGEARPTYRALTWITVTEFGLREQVGEGIGVLVLLLLIIISYVILRPVSDRAIG